jgi:hypothetical protein
MDEVASAAIAVGAATVALWFTPLAPLDGVRPLVLVVSIMVLAGCTMLGLAFVALQARMQEEYGDDTVLPGRHVSV